MRIRIIKNYFLTEVLGIRLKPQTIQLPITGKCNSKCSTCNIWKQKEHHDVNVDKLDKVLKDPYLLNVRNIGINGGEPFLHKDFVKVVETVLNLPRLENIYIISNGLATNRILSCLTDIKPKCDRKGVKILLTISLDATNEEYLKVRGVPGYNQVIQTIKCISDDKNKYCYSLTIGTTISRNNIESIAEIRALALEMNYQVNYHLAVPNRRICTADDSAYSVFEDENSLALATELFYGLFKYSQGLKQRLLYFQNYYYLKSNGKTRISGCTYKTQDITLDENLNLYFCAKESYSIGNAYGNSVKELLTSRRAKQERKRIISLCTQCGHYITMPTFKGAILFLLELLKPSVWIKYKILS